MLQRGRKATAALAVVPLAVGLLPEPPSTLTPKQAELWRGIVATKPAGWWDAGSLPSLIAYVKAIEAHAVTSAQLDGFDPEWLATEDGLDRFDRLTKLFERLSRLIASLATKMRLTQQSRYDKQGAGVAGRSVGTGTRPWETAERAEEAKPAPKSATG